MKHGLDLEAIALEIKTAQDEVRQLEPLTSRFREFGIPVAYEVARLIHESRLREGAIAVGRKIGFTNPSMWTLFGVRDPIWAYVYDTTVVRLSHTFTECDIGRFLEPKIEPEVVVHFASAPPVGGGPVEILECIDWIAHGIEIVQSHFPGWKFGAADTVADWALHGTLLLGQPQAAGQLGADLVNLLKNFSVALSCDGEVKEVGRGSNVLGNPLQAVAHLTTVLASQPNALMLHAGELVTTGTLTTAFSIRSGETWSTELKSVGLPGITVQFVT